MAGSARQSRPSGRASARRRRDAGRIALLDKLRRAYWKEKGEVDRPPAPPMGEHGPDCATGPDRAYRADRDGSPAEWRRRQDEKERLAAEAQRAWEEKAKAEAEEWAKREAGRGGSDGESDAAEGRR